MTSRDAARRRALREALHPLRGDRQDFAPLLALTAGARFVLIGEASHGTHEFYRIRAEITKRLIVEQGFTAVAIEGDWPDAARVHRFVTGQPGDREAERALAGFLRFPQWMWRNADVLDFVGWLRAHNEARAPGTPAVGFHGLDLYGMHRAMAAVLAYLERVDPPAAARARTRYACFDQFGQDVQLYGYSTSLGLTRSCEDEVVGQLVEMQRRLVHGEPEEAFQAEQNARLVASAERYYRAMFGRTALTWNLRDQHMAETLAALDHFLSRAGHPARIVVWAHNSHVGDARATERHRAGELNIGQLVREAHPEACRLIGFSGYTGTVSAASNWDEPVERKRVRPALPGSLEALLHDVGVPNFLLLTRHPAVREALSAPRLQRAIGVIYRPETERESHYYHVELPRQFDAMLHYDVTRAVEPLERSGLWDAGELPDTWPMAL